MTPDTTSAASSRAQTVRELQELIATLDRRVPQVKRVEEISIARAASALKCEALERIEELEREAPPVVVPFLESVNNLHDDLDDEHDGRADQKNEERE
jgi:hypothetical protein